MRSAVGALALITWLVLPATGLCAGKAATGEGTKPNNTAPKAPARVKVSEAQRLFAAIGAGKEVEHSFTQLRALADKGDREAAALVAAQLYPGDVNGALPYALRSFGKPAPLPREVMLIQGFRCNGGFNEQQALTSAEQRLQARELDAEERAANLIVMGLLHEYGGGGITASKVKALDYFSQAAGHGSAFALSLQGRIYEFDGGKEIPADRTKALDLYGQAAARRDPYGLFLLAELHKEMGNTTEWPTLVRTAAELGNENAMAAYGDWLVRKKDSKSVDEGLRWLELGIRLHGLQAFEKLAQLMEEGLIPVEHPVALAWVRYGDAGKFPCGNPLAAEGMARLLPRLKELPASVIANLSEDGAPGLASDLLTRNGNSKSVRDSVVAWAAENEDIDAGQRVTLLVWSVRYALQYDPREAMGDPGAYVATLLAPLEQVARSGSVDEYLDDADAIASMLIKGLHENRAVAAEEIAAVEAEVRAHAGVMGEAARRRVAAMSREREREAWRAAKREHPEVLSEEEFTACIEDADNLDAFDDRLESRQVMLETYRASVEFQRSIYETAPSSAGREILNQSIDNFNQALNEARAMEEEYNEAVDDSNRRCVGRRILISMHERLCESRMENRFCRENGRD